MKLTQKKDFSDITKLGTTGNLKKLARHKASTKRAVLLKIRNFWTNLTSTMASPMSRKVQKKAFLLKGYLLDNVQYLLYVKSTL